jgi:hypothetical protein
MFARVIHQFQMSTTGPADSSQDNTRGLDDSGNLRREPPANQEKRKKTKNVVIDRICDVQLFSFSPGQWTVDTLFFGLFKTR